MLVFSYTVNTTMASSLHNELLIYTSLKQTGSRSSTEGVVGAVTRNSGKLTKTSNGSFQLVVPYRSIRIPTGCFFLGAVGRMHFLVDQLDTSSGRA